MIYKKEIMIDITIPNKIRIQLGFINDIKLDKKPLRPILSNNYDQLKFPTGKDH